jgi:hypothetical protein
MLWNVILHQVAHGQATLRLSLPCLNRTVIVVGVFVRNAAPLQRSMTAVRGGYVVWKLVRSKHGSTSGSCDNGYLMLPMRAYPSDQPVQTDSRTNSRQVPVDWCREGEQR